MFTSAWPCALPHNDVTSVDHVYICYRIVGLTYLSSNCVGRACSRCIPTVWHVPAPNTTFFPPATLLRYNVPQLRN